jgi:hypothetical protein
MLDVAGASGAETVVPFGEALAAERWPSMSPIDNGRSPQDRASALRIGVEER